MTKDRTKYTYRLDVRYENGAGTSTELSDQQTAIRDGWRAAGNPFVTSAKVLRAPEGSFSFRQVHNIKG
jgi:hypothetical protein